MLGSSPTAQHPLLPSLIRYPATDKRASHLVLPFSLPVFGFFSVYKCGLFLVDLDSGRLHRINISVTYFCIT